MLEPVSAEWDHWGFFELFLDDMAAVRWFESRRWPGGLRCPRCESADAAVVRDLQPMLYRRQSRRGRFSVMSRMMMHVLGAWRPFVAVGSFSGRRESQGRGLGAARCGSCWWPGRWIWGIGRRIRAVLVEAVWRVLRACGGRWGLHRWHSCEHARRKARGARRRERNGGPMPVVGVKGGVVAKSVARAGAGTLAAAVWQHRPGSSVLPPR